MKKTFSSLNLWCCAFPDYMLLHLVAEGHLSKYFDSEGQWEAPSRIKIHWMFRMLPSVQMTNQIPQYHYSDAVVWMSTTANCVRTAGDQSQNLWHLWCAEHSIINVLLMSCSSFSPTALWNWLPSAQQVKQSWCTCWCIFVISTVKDTVNTAPRPPCTGAKTEALSKYQVSYLQL